jgi:predicted DNA-binding transcriptional regulator AlpA
MPGKISIPTPGLADPLLLDIAATAHALGCSPGLIWAMRRRGEFGPLPVCLGRSTRFRADEIRAWIAAGAPPRVKWAATWKGAK